MRGWKRTCRRVTDSALAGREPWITPGDALRLGKLAAGYALTGLLPGSMDRGAHQAVAPSGRCRIEGTPGGRGRPDKRPWLGPEVAGVPVAWIARDHAHRVREEHWGVWRALHRRGWHPTVDVEGRDHLAAALSRGRGAVLWGTSFCGTLVVKVGLRAAGVDLVHLSTGDHGVPRPPSRVGRRILARSLVKAETRYVDERVLIDPSGGRYLRVLKQRLAENRVVWLYGESPPGRASVEAPLFGHARPVPDGSTRPSPFARVRPCCPCTSAARRPVDTAS